MLYEGQIEMKKQLHCNVVTAKKKRRAQRVMQETHPNSEWANGRESCRGRRH